jgi:hypothetical protein
MTRRLLVFAFLLPAQAWAYPGSVRWGYANCTACHYNPAGGGLITPYGRQMSRTLLSSGGGEREAQLAWGAVRPPAWLDIGGDFAFLHTSRETADTSNGFHLYQADLDVVATHRRLLVHGSVGVEPNMKNRRSGGHTALSRRHYLQVNMTPTLSVRAGRFLPNFGLDVTTKKSLGWLETYNVEANWIREKVSLAATGSFGRPDAPELDRERGGSANVSLFFMEKRKVGLGYAHKETRAYRRDVVAAYTVIGLGKRAYLLAEADVEKRKAKTASAGAVTSVTTNAMAAYEIVKGLYAVALHDAARQNPDGTGPMVGSYGAGLRFFPRTHFDLYVRWREHGRRSVAPEYMEGLTATLHFYP